MIDYTLDWMTILIDTGYQIEMTDWRWMNELVIHGKIEICKCICIYKRMHMHMCFHLFTCVCVCVCVRTCVRMCRCVSHVSNEHGQDPVVHRLADQPGVGCDSIVTPLWLRWFQASLWIRSGLQKHGSLASWATVTGTLDTTNRCKGKESLT